MATRGTKPQARDRERRDTARDRPAPRPPVRDSRRGTRARATVRRIDPWTILKLSLVFYFCVLLIVMLGLTVFWGVIHSIGLIVALQELLLNVGLDLVTINGGNIARVIFLLGLLNVVLWSGVNVFMAFLYNLLADVLGGLRVTLQLDDA